MITDGLKVFTKTAFTVVGWMVAIVAVVAWRSNGNMLAVSLAAGLPIGVLTLWFIVHVSEASKLDPRVLERNIQTNRIRARRPSVETQALARMPLPSSGRKRPQATQEKAASPHVATVASSAPKRPPILRPETLAPKVVAPTSRELPSDSNANARPESVAPAALDMSAVFSLDNEESSGRYDFLDAGNYLYKPSSGKDRKTLDLFGSGQLLTENEIDENRKAQGQTAEPMDSDAEFNWKE